MNNFRQTLGSFRKAVTGKLSDISRAVRRQNPAQMWGRVFDLRKKRLVELDGFKLFVMPNDYVGLSILKSKQYEAHVTAQIRKVLKEGDVFLDIGANLGYFTMLASSLVKSSGKVIAFEPNPQNLQLIYSSLVENEAKNVSVYPFAASDTATILKFANVGSNGVVVEHGKDHKHYLLVPAVVLDEMLKNELRIDLIKIDIEGHEPSAVRGMTCLINKFRPLMFTEFHPWVMQRYSPTSPTEYLEDLFSFKYKLSILDPSGKCIAVSTAKDVLDYWESLRSETIHLDLFAEPS